MKNIQVYLNRSMPADADIEKHMDFASVFKQFQKINLPFYKQVWFKWGLATVLIAAGVTMAISNLTGDNTKKEAIQTPVVTKTSTTKMAEETPCINPPVDGGKGQTENFLLSSLRDTVIYTSTGTKLYVPANVAGNGNYELRVREFDKTSEIFLSGIPMDYDSAGNKYAFESAGMMEILAYRNNQPVRMQPGKHIAVNMASTVKGNDFNVYYLDTIARAWKYEGRDKVTRLNKPSNAVVIRPPKEVLTEKQLKDSVEDCQKNLTVLTREIDSINTVKPVAPNKADTSAWYFDIRFDPKKFPEMKAFKNAHFQVLPECKFFNQSFYSTKWQNINIKQVLRGEKYVIHVDRKIDGRKVNYDIPVKPVYEGKSYDSAYTAFDKAFKMYEKELVRAQKEKDAQQERMRKYEERIKKTDFQSVNTNDNGIITVTQTNTNYVQNLSGADKVMRTFTANRFGVWNCDRPLPYKRNEHVEITARCNATGEIIKDGKMYVSDVAKRAIFTYDEKERGKVGVEGECQYIVWIVDKDEQLHFARLVFSDHKLPEIRKVVLNMDVSTSIPSNPLQLKKLLGI